MTKNKKMKEKSIYLNLLTIKFYFVLKKFLTLNHEKKCNIPALLRRFSRGSGLYR